MDTENCAPDRWALANRTRFVWLVGVFMFGIAFGLVNALLLLGSADMRNHPLWHKALMVAGVTLIVGPIAGWLWGQIMWMFIARRARRRDTWASYENRIAACEKRIAELEDKAS